MSNFQFVQAQNFALAGAGSIAGATSIILKSFKAIDGLTNLTMADFGLLGFATIEPGNGTQEEQISFTGVVQNANGTATLTGVKTVIFLSPYTATSGLAKTHPGSATFIISNTSGFYDQFAIKNNDETITGDWTFSGQVTFDIAPISPITNPLATTVIYGISRLSFAPDSALDPITVSTNDPRVPVAYAVDSVGTDTYAITPSPAITAYAAGQHFTFKVGTANTGPATLNVNGLGAKAIVKDVSSALITGDILLGQIVEVVYDGTNMQLISSNYPPIASITVKGLVEQATPAEFNAGTATGGTGAPLFINPADLPGQYIQGALGNTVAKTMFNIQLPFTLWTGAVANDTTTTQQNWMRTSAATVYIPPTATSADFRSTSTAFLVTNDSGNSFMLTGASTYLLWNWNKLLVLDFMARLPASGTGDLFMGFCVTDGDVVLVYNSTASTGRVGFAQKSTGELYTVVAKSTGVSNTDISSGLTLTNWNNYRIELTLGGNTLFYVNGVLKATVANTNLLTTTNLVNIGFGRSNTTLFQVTAPNLSVQLI